MTTNNRRVGIGNSTSVGIAAPHLYRRRVLFADHDDLERLSWYECNQKRYEAQQRGGNVAVSVSRLRVQQVRWHKLSDTLIECVCVRCGRIFPVSLPALRNTNTEK